jgi:hypothetical protein
MEGFSTAAAMCNTGGKARGSKSVEKESKVGAD